MQVVTLRLPDDLHSRLKDAAAADQRSLNSEMLWLLGRALDTRQEAGE